MEDTEDANEVHWVGHQLPPEVYDPGLGAGTESWEDDEVYWNFEADGWHGYSQDDSGYWWETDGNGSYWASDGGVDLTPEEIKELEESYMAYENKVRTFAQSRQLQRAKGSSRGFFPLQMMKGSGKKGKFKGKGKERKRVRNYFDLELYYILKTAVCGSGCRGLYFFLKGRVLHLWRDRPWIPNLPTKVQPSSEVWQRWQEGHLLD